MLGFVSALFLQLGDNWYFLGETDSHHSPSLSIILFTLIWIQTCTIMCTTRKPPGGYLPQVAVYRERKQYVVLLFHPSEENKGDDTNCSASGERNLKARLEFWLKIFGKYRVICKLMMLIIWWVMKCILPSILGSKRDNHMKNIVKDRSKNLF